MSAATDDDFKQATRALADARARHSALVAEAHRTGGSPELDDNLHAAAYTLAAAENHRQELLRKPTS